jgi:hypothetical protein
MLKHHVFATFFLIAISVATHANTAEVSLTRLLAHPQQFNGKQVSFVAYWDSDGHATSLRAGPSADAPRIYCDFEKARLPVKKLIENIPHGSWVHVVGIFRYVDMTVHTLPDGSRAVASGFGWMNSYDRALIDITEFTRVRPNRI